MKAERNETRGSLLGPNSDHLERASILEHLPGILRLSSEDCGLSARQCSLRPANAEGSPSLVTLSPSPSFHTQQTLDTERDNATSQHARRSFRLPKTDSQKNCRLWTAGPQNDEPASSKAEQHQKTFIINLSDDSSDDDDSDTSSQATTEVPRGVRFQLGGNDSQDDTGEAAFRAQPAGDMNGELDLVDDKQPQEHNAGQPAIAPVGTRQNEIPDSERSDDEVPAGTQTTNAHTNAHTASNIDVEADVNPANTGPAPHDKAKKSARKGPRMVASAGKTKKRKASDQEASTAARTGGREGASAPKNPKKRKSSDGVSLEMSRYKTYTN
ncbi:hypothetical protein MBR_10676, partial [Metarhizium brunneum ARSEF 3297]